MFSTCSRGKIRALKGLGSPISVVLLESAHNGPMHGLAVLPACDIPQQIFHFPNISNLLKPPVYLWFSQNFKHCSLRSMFPGILSLIF